MWAVLTFIGPKRATNAASKQGLGAALFRVSGITIAP
jgi:hypothetical protein